MNIIIITILLIITLLSFAAFYVAFSGHLKIRKSKARALSNKVRFYVARDKDKTLWLYLGKPIKDEDCDRYIPYRGGNAIIGRDKFKDFNLNPNDFKNLSFDDNPVEVFLNLED